MLAAVQVVRNAVVVQLAERKPALATRVWPSHPESKLWTGLTQIGLAAGRRQPVDPGTLELISDGARKAPLRPEPFLVRGVQAQLAGDRRLAERAFVAAKLRDGRSIPARYFLAEHYFRSGNAPAGLREIAILARMVPNGVTNLAPYVAAYAKDRRNRSQLKALFRSDPQLEEAALTTLATEAGNSDLILELARPASAPPQWTARLLETLINAGQYAKARQIWVRIARVPAAAAARPIFDAGFADNRTPPPFNWTLTSSTVGLAERQTGGRLHVVYYGQEDGTLASQMLVLDPGRYALSMRISGDSNRARSLAWVLACAGSKTSLLSLRLDQKAAAARGADFDVPAGCAAQNLQLVGTAPEVPQEADVVIFNLALRRLAS